MYNSESSAGVLRRYYERRARVLYGSVLWWALGAGQRGACVFVTGLRLAYGKRKVW